MAGSTDDQYGAGDNEAKLGGAWGASPPIMHSWCLQPDQPTRASECAQGEGLDSRSRLANDMDDDCGFDLNLGLSLGGSKCSKPKGKEREKEVLLDRDVFREKDSIRASHAGHGERGEGGVAKDSNGEEVSQGGVMFKPLKMEQDGASRVQTFWQDLDRSGSDGKDKGVGGPFSGRQVSSAQQTLEPNRRAAESSVAEDSKMFAQHMWQALQGKAAQPEHQRVPLSPQDEASLIKELQGLPPQAVATAAAWARVVAQGGFPMQLLEAIKDGVDPVTRGVALQRSLSMKSYSSGPHSEVIPAPSPPVSQTAPSTGDLDRSDSDVSKNMHIDQQQRQVAMIQQQEMAEQQRKREQTQKRQEARRKRKALLEGHKLSKKTKKEEERPGSCGPGGSTGNTPPGSGLRRTSSLQPSSGVTKENSVSTVSSPPDSQDASHHGGTNSLTAFRRPGSSSWMQNWDGNPQMGGASAGPGKAKLEKMQATAGGDGRVDSGEQMFEIRRALERARDRGMKEGRSGDSESAGHVDSNSEGRKVGSPDVVQMQKMEPDASAGGKHPLNWQEGAGLGPPGMANGQIDPAWIQKIIEAQLSSYQLAAMLENRENAAKPVPLSIPQMPRRGDGGGERVGPAAEAEKATRKRSRTSSQTSSGGTENSDGKDEKMHHVARADHGDAEALSSPQGNSNSTGGEGRANGAGGFMPSMSTAMAMANMPFPSSGGFPMMPGPFPFPMPVPPGGGAGGVPFSMPFPFPYLMQFAPSPAGGGDGNQEARGHPSMPSPFQIAIPPGYPPFQIQTPEGPAGWPSPVVRPHATPPQSPPRSGAGKGGKPGPGREDEKHGGRGAKGNEHARSRNASPARELPAQSLVKASSMGSGAFNRLRSTAPANSSPLVPQFGISRSKSDAAALRRDGSVGSAFAALAVESPPGPSNGQANGQANHVVQSGSVTRSSGGGSLPRPDVSSSRGGGGLGEEAAPSAAVLQGASGSAGQAEVVAAQSTSAADEDVKRPHTAGMWRQGSLPSFEGMAGQEASSLRAGIAAGQQFGGTGSPPDLPWVTCNGTISGVLYRVEKGQVRIVCACHGRHMTPAEFVQHAGCGEIPNPEKAIVVGPFTVMSQQPASAQA